MLRMFWQTCITITIFIKLFFTRLHLLMFERCKKATVFLFSGKKKQKHNPNTPPLNRQITFPEMWVISAF